ncbi:hypothetical protein LTR62_001064 [Meristemomyces frigidus]|uniref:SHSP domain-containing protein n=1 Tax=Meristemomyces frigidus TaxID=1508187 RepID=A0AAN7T9K9_9PEZI|nr:hypothetical protein LTR62_001064 [Meristemomyces frigidus]
MPSVRYYNQTAPFWDFIASMEEQGASHPLFAGRQQQGEESSSDNEQHGPNPWTDGWAGFPFGGMPHRGGRHGHHGRNGPPPPPPAAPAAANEGMENNPDEGPSEPRQVPSFFSQQPHHGPTHGPGRRNRCGGRGRGGFGGQWGRHGPAGFGPGAFGGLAEMFQSQLFGDDNSKSANNNSDKSEDFTPDVDVFDTADSFIVHISLPGAKKEDVGVNWDSEKSELCIAGVIYRPGDEELLKTLALDERKAGVFDRKVRLGSRANAAQVDVEGISAKLEDGILRVEVPKLDAGYVEIKKVDVE